MKHTNCQAVWWSLFFPLKNSVRHHLKSPNGCEIIRTREYMSLHVAPRQKPLMNKKEWTASLLKMEPISCPETSVTDYQLTLRNIPEERRLHLHRGWSLKLRIPILHSNGDYLFDRQYKWKQTRISHTHKACSPCYPGCWTETTDAQITQVLFWNKILRLVFKINSVIKELDRQITVWW